MADPGRRTRVPYRSDDDRTRRQTYGHAYGQSAGRRGTAQTGRHAASQQREAIDPVFRGGVADQGIYAGRVTRTSPVLNVVKVIVGIIIAFAVVFGLVTLIGNLVFPTGQLPVDDSEPAYALTPQLIGQVPAADEVTAFTLSDEEAPALTNSQTRSIKRSIDSVATAGDCGFIFLNVGTGKGIAYRTDASFYSSSVFDAVYGTYVCQSIVDKGTAGLGTLVKLPEEGLPNQWDVTFTPGKEFSLQELLTASLKDSNLNAFATLRTTYDGVSYDEWASDIGATDCLVNPEQNHPHMSVRSAARFWADLNDYIAKGSDASAFLAETLAAPDHTFIADAIASSDISVISKAGYTWDAESHWCSLSDCALIDDGGETYLLCILTSLPASESAVDVFKSLVTTLYNLRSTLSAEA